MTIICYVAADFVSPEGDKFSITGKELGIIKEAPEWIGKTLLFKWLAKDGSIKFVSKDNRIQAENDPLAGIDAEGKRFIKEEPEAVREPVEVVTEVSTKKRTRKKKDDAE